MSGIPESKLLEYRRRFSDRIPTVGKGKDRIHPEEAVPIFKAIHREQTGERIHMLQGKQYYDLKEISTLLGLSRSLLYSYISEEGDKVPRVKQGKRWLFPEEAVEAFKNIRKSREDRKKRRVEGLYSIRDLSRILGISESTLHQYKRKYADKIPSVGTGRDRKYPEEAIEVFRGLREGGPGSGKEGFYSLSQVSEMTGIPTHTLLYYRRTYPDKIPVAEGRRSRVYTDDSIEAFRKLRARPGRRGRTSAAPGLTKVAPRLDAIESRIETLEGRLEEATRMLREVLERIPGQTALERGEGSGS
jgi:DNA-binding transcriptional MerR regulator